MKGGRWTEPGVSKESGEEGTAVAEGTPAGHCWAGNLLARHGSPEGKTTEPCPFNSEISTMTWRGFGPGALHDETRRGSAQDAPAYTALLRGTWHAFGGTWVQVGWARVVEEALTEPGLAPEPVRWKRPSKDRKNGQSLRSSGVRAC